MAIQDVYADLRTKGKFIFDAASELTIADGAITPTQTFHSVDTESDAASDNLDTISGGVSGEILYLVAAHTDRTVVIRHGEGNILTSDGSDFSLDSTDLEVCLHYDGTNWRLISGGGGASSFLDLTDTPAAYTDKAGYFCKVNDDEDEIEFCGAADMEKASRTIYADADDGDDDTGDGSSGSPYETYSKALSTVKNVIADGITITIHLNAATATYTPVSTGRVCIGTGNLVIEGEMIQEETATADSGTETTLTDSGAFSGDTYAGKLVHITAGTGSGDYRVIKSHTNDTLTVIGAFSSSPDGTSVYEILSWGAFINGSTIWYLLSCKGTIQFIGCTNAETVVFRPDVGGNWGVKGTSITFSGSGVAIYPSGGPFSIKVEYSVFDGASNGSFAARYADVFGVMTFYQTWIKGFTSHAIWCDANGSCTIIRKGTIVDGTNGNTTIILVAKGSIVSLYSSGTGNKAEIIMDTDNTYGIYAEEGGGVLYASTSTVTYTGTPGTANTGADAATFGFISA
jgi:hypothetical protein